MSLALGHPVSHSSSSFHEHGSRAFYVQSLEALRRYPLGRDLGCGSHRIHRVFVGESNRGPRGVTRALDRDLRRITLETFRSKRKVKNWVSFWQGCGRKAHREAETIQSSAHSPEVSSDPSEAVGLPKFAGIVSELQRRACGLHTHITLVACFWGVAQLFKNLCLGRVSSCYQETCVNWVLPLITALGRQR